MCAVFSRSAKALKKLNSSDADQQISGLQLLQERAQEDTSSLLCRHPECLHTAVRLLHSTNSKVKKAAASCLACLASYGARDKVCAEFGAVEGLVGMLGDSSAEVQLQAVHTLAVLLARTMVLGSDSAAMQVDCVLQDRICSMPGALSALVPLLNSTSTRSSSGSNSSLKHVQNTGIGVTVQMESLSKLRIAVPGVKVRGGVDKPPAAGGLTVPGMMPSSTADTAEAAVRLIACLAYNHPANQAAIAAVPGAVIALLHLLRSNCSATQLAAAEALAALSEGEWYSSHGACIKTCCSTHKA